MTRAASLAVPALLLSVAAGLAVTRTLPDWVAIALRAAPPVVFVVGALVGLLLQQGRLALALVSLALADLALAHLGTPVVLDAVAILLPLNLGAIACLAEASLLTAPGTARLGAIALQASLVVLLQRLEVAAVAPSLDRVGPDLASWTTVPPIALATFAAGLGLVAVGFRMSSRPLAVGAAWALLASFLALDTAGAGGSPRVHLVIAGLLLVTGAALEPRPSRYVDAMTRLPGRLGLNETLRRLPRRYALACVEIDDFRTFREEHGADAARRMLRRVAGTLAGVGGGGCAFYCEGHAFAIVFRRTSAAAAARHLDVVRRAVELAMLDVRVPERPRPGRPARAGGVEMAVAVTISVGVAQPERPGVDPHEVLLAAGRALDRAKQSGRSRVAGPLPEGSRIVSAG